MGGRFLTYSVIVLAVLAAGLALPVPAETLTALHWPSPRTLLSSTPKVVIAGPSTVDGISRCDVDKRNIAQDIAAMAHRPVIDISNAGQRLEESIEAAALFARAPGADRVVLAVTPAEFSDEGGGFQAHQYYAFRTLNPGVKLAPLGEYFRGHPSLSGNLGFEYQPFDYRGRSYSGLDYFNKALFPREDAGPCPEGDGDGSPDIAAVAYLRLVKYPPVSRNFELVASLDATLKASGKRLVVALFPTDTIYLRMLDASWPALVDQRRKDIVAALTQRGVTVVDFPEELPKADFKDRFCGCTHMTERGRQYVSQRIAAAL